jgi:hypothetical protein
MRVIMIVVIGLIAIFVIGCTTSSGVVSMGQDSYLLTRTTKSFRGSAMPVKAAAIKEADEYCKKLGKQILITKTVQQDMKPFQSDASVEIYFKCLPSDSPELKNPPQIQEIRN